MTIKNTAERVRVFIGTEEKTEIARKVLQVSIQRNTEMVVDFIPMIGKEWEYSTKGITVGTGFSLRRWMIPKFCGFQGRAIYIDADQLVFGDIWDLWTMPELVGGPRGDRTSTWCTYQPCKFFQGNVPNTSVMVIDCDRAKDQWQYDIAKVLDFLRTHPAKIEYANLMYAINMKPQPMRIPTEWNHLNVYDKKTKLLHFTKEPEQPWYKPDHPLAELWRKALLVAIAGGAVTRAEFLEQLNNWDVKLDWRSTNGLHPEYATFLRRFSDYVRNEELPFIEKWNAHLRESKGVA